MIEQGTPEFIKNSEGRILQWKNCNCKNGGRYVRKSLFETINAKCNKCVKNSIGLKNTKHGMKYSKEYSSWSAMKDRCLNKSSKDFVNYGAKGITICNEWINSFEQFLKDMGSKPKNYSIDRIDNKKGYFKENCRWANANTQQRNKSNSLWVEWKGEVKHIMEIAQELGISKGAAHLRYKRGTLYV